MAIAAQPFALPLTDEDREWMEAQEYAQTHTIEDALRSGIRVIAESAGSGEITSEQAGRYMRVLMAEYVAVIATEQINGYLERRLAPWMSGRPGLRRQRGHRRSALV